MNPYKKAAQVLDSAAGGPPSAPRSSGSPAPSEAPMRVVGKKYMDPQSRSDEEYMEGAQRKINQRLAAGAERLSGEYRQRRMIDRRYGRRNGR